MDGEVMDSGERTEAALAAFSGEQDNADAGSQTNDSGAAGGEQQTADDSQNAREQTPGEETTEGQLTDEQINADPRFQELSTFREDVVTALSEFPGLVGENGAPDLQQASAQLKDASILYDIMAGKGTPSALLDVMAQNAGWKDEQKQAVAQDLIQWLTKSGFLKDGQAAVKKADDPGFKDPLQARLDKLENENKTREQQEAARKTAEHQENVFKTKFLPQVEKLCQQKGVPKEDFPDYASRVASLIQGNKAILGRIEKGNFVDLHKFFTQVYNAEVNRLQRWTKSQTAAAAAKEKNPKIPAGGASPSPAGSAKVAPKTRDDRIAAATELMSNP
jgi:hypothetical protein